jgi:hypothetical protein
MISIRVTKLRTRRRYSVGAALLLSQVVGYEFNDRGSDRRVSFKRVPVPNGRPASVSAYGFSAHHAGHRILSDACGNAEHRRRDTNLR